MTARKIRELRETTGQHGELLAAISDSCALTEQVKGCAAHGPGHGRLEDLAPRVGGLHQVLTEELAQLRGDVDVLLAER